MRWEETKEDAGEEPGALPGCREIHVTAGGFTVIATREMRPAWQGLTR